MDQAFPPLCTFLLYIFGQSCCVSKAIELQLVLVSHLEACTCAVCENIKAKVFDQAHICELLNFVRVDHYKGHGRQGGVQATEDDVEVGILTCPVMFHNHIRGSLGEVFAATCPEAFMETSIDEDVDTSIVQKIPKCPHAALRASRPSLEGKLCEPAVDRNLEFEALWVLGLPVV